MKNDKIACFLDIDGTIYDSSIKGVRQSTIDIIDKLSCDPSYDLYIASGRSLNTISNMKEYFSKFKGFVLTNGQTIIIDEKIVFDGKIDKDLTIDFVKYCKVNKFPIVLLTNDLLYYNIEDELLKSNFENYIKAPLYKLEDHDIYDQVTQIWLFTSNETNELIQKAYPSLNIINWGNFGADIVPCGITKGQGVLKVIEMMGYKLENTYAIGDSDNDVVMFKVVGTSICMGNGTKKAKESAKIVGFNISDDGFYKNIEKYVLKKELL